MNRSPGHTLVSVILPTRNRASLLKRAVLSVLGQTYRNLELIIVDDASTDGTAELLATMEDPRVRVIRRLRNGGAAAARNAGLAEARGLLIAFQDDDDIWLLQKLEKQVRALDEAGESVGWCLAAHVRIEPNRSIYIGGDKYVRGIKYDEGNVFGRTNYSLIATPGWLVRRSVLERTGGFDERIRSWDDWELGLRICRICERVVVDEPLWIQDHVLGSGLMLATRARADDLRLIAEKHADLWADKPWVRAKHDYFIGRVETMYDPPPAGRDRLWRSFRTDPFQPRTWAALALAYVGTGVTRSVTRRVREMREAWKS